MSNKYKQSLHRILNKQSKSIKIRRIDRHSFFTVLPNTETKVRLDLFIGMQKKN